MPLTFYVNVLMCCITPTEMTYAYPPKNGLNLGVKYKAQRQTVTLSGIRVHIHIQGKCHQQIK